DRVTLRYWYLDSSVQAAVFTCDFWQPSSVASTCGITVTPGTLTTPTPSANHFLEIGFGSAYYQNTWLSQVGSFPMDFRLHLSDYSNFNVTDDYSYVPATTTTRVQNPHITGYVDGVLVWGEEP